MTTSNSTSAPSRSLSALSLTALGIVFGDIGTSPLYAVRDAFHHGHGLAVNETNVLGILSLIVWSLIVVISIKYLLIVMRADNHGEGGVLALTQLAFLSSARGSNARTRNVILMIGLFGSALLFGDGIITPAMSVLSAVEGLKTATDIFTPYIIPITIGILLVLFSAQQHGTARIGAIFGPVILLWFVTIAALGISGAVHNPHVFVAVNPLYAIRFFAENGWLGVLALGAVFLVCTGGEALYADMGHLGRKPIERAWFFIALPALLLNYFGQGALLLKDPSAAVNPFFSLAPTWLIYPLVALATSAAVIASQALITGIFSLTHQAVQLGYISRFRIIHTSSDEIGQIYVPRINWILFTFTALVVYGFGSSTALTGAYGIAVAATMVITILLVAIVARYLWKWSRWSVALMLIFFLSIDIFFLIANAAKIVHGGWFPLVLAAVVFTIMTTWITGRKILRVNLRELSIPTSDFLARITNEKPQRIAGTAVFMNGDRRIAPIAILQNLRHNRVVHEQNIFLTFISKEIPVVEESKRVEIIPLGENFFQVIASYGFIETPDILHVLRTCQAELNLDIPNLTFFLGHQTLIPSEKPGMALWRERLFSFMERNAERPTAYFNIPADQIVEIGVQVKI